MSAFDKTLTSTPDEIAFLDDLAPVAAAARRSLRLNRLMLTGSAAIMQLRLADFGTHTPAGLNLRPIDNVHVIIGTLGGAGDPHAAHAGGINPRHIGETRPSGEIMIAPAFHASRHPRTDRLNINHAGATTLSHEFLHRLQFHELLDYGDSPAMAQRFVLPVLSVPTPTTLRELGQYILLKFRRAAVSYEQADRTDSVKIRLSHIFGLNSLSVGQYLVRDHEIQARMHEILLAGHAAWGRMPATRTELYAALHGAGLTLGGNALATLHATPEGRRAAKTFSMPHNIRFLVDFAVTGVNDVTAYMVTRQARDNLWDHAIPALYGNMLEMYGDTLGRERMDLGHNRRQILNVTRALLRAPEPDLDKLTLAVSRVSPGNAAECVSHLYAKLSGNDKALHYMPHVISVLLGNPSCRSALIAPSRFSAYGRASLLSPLEGTLYGGDSKSTRLLLNAGADLFAPVERYNPVTGMDIKISALSLAADMPFLRRRWGKNSDAYQKLLTALTELNAHTPAHDRDRKRPLWLAGRAEPVMASFNDALAWAGLTPPGHKKTAKHSVPAPRADGA